MFGDKVVLSQEVEEEVNSPVIGDTGPQLGKVLANYAAENFYSQAGPPEVEEGVKEELKEQSNVVLGSTQNAGDIAYSTTTQNVKPPKQDPLGKIVGRITPRPPPAAKPLLSDIRQFHIQKLKAESAVRFKEGKALAQSHLELNWLLENETEIAQQLNDIYFKRWDIENESIKRDIEFARAMKVNPDNYMQSIGRGGRVASVFAVGVSQLAAGAGNVNSVVKRLDAAIKRDISAQEANIKQAWRGVSESQNQQSREIEQLIQYYTFRDRATAMATAALAARAGTIKQHAANEMEYIAGESIEKEMLSRMVVALANEAASRTSFLLDSTVHSAAEFFRKKREADKIGNQLFAENMGDLAGMRMDPTVSTMSGQQFAPGQELPAQAGVAPTAGGPQPAAAPVTTRASKRGTAQVPAKQAPAVGMSTVEGTEEVVPTAPTEAAPETKQRAATAKETVEFAALNDPIIQKYGSYEAEIRTRKNWRNASEVIPLKKAFALQDKGKYDTASGIPDAQVLMSRDRAKGLPKRSKRLADLFDLHNTGAELDDKQRHALLQGIRREQEWKFRTQDINSYMKMETVTADDRSTLYSNVIELGANRALKIRANRGDLIGGETPGAREKAAIKRGELADQALSVYNLLDTISASAGRVRAQGAGSIMGIMAVEGKGGTGTIKWLPNFDEDMFAAFNINESTLTALGAKVMKGIDPSGRLTDQDIVVGKAMISGGIFTKRTIALDAVEGLVRKAMGKKDISDTSIRRSINAIFQELSLEMMQTMAFQQLGASIVWDPSIQNVITQRWDNAERWLLSERKQDEEGAAGTGEYGGASPVGRFLFGPKGEGVLESGVEETE